MIDYISGYWWLNSTSSPSVLPVMQKEGEGQVEVWGAESPNPLLMLWSFWWPSPTLKLSRDPKPLIILWTCKRHSYHSRNSKNFRIFVCRIRRTRDKDQIYIAYYVIRNNTTYRAMSAKLMNTENQWHEGGIICVSILSQPTYAKSLKCLLTQDLRTYLIWDPVLRDHCLSLLSHMIEIDWSWVFMLFFCSYWL